MVAADTWSCQTSARSPDRAEVAPRIRRSPLRSFDGDDPAGSGHCLADQHREQPRAGIQVEDDIPRLRPQSGENRADERRRRARMHLPEAARVDLEVVPAHVMMQPSRAFEHVDDVRRAPPASRPRSLAETAAGRHSAASLSRGDLVVAGPGTAQRRVITDARHAERAGVHRL
jgi:hypothetical protein